MPAALVQYLALTTRDILPYRLDNTILLQKGINRQLVCCLSLEQETYTDKLL